MPSTTRNHFIDILRGISISLVLLHHFNIVYTLRDTALAQLTGWMFLHALLRNGNYGVTIFFVISGFLITSDAKMRFKGLASIDVQSFYRRRAGRILPCVVLLVFLVNVLAWCDVPIFRNDPQSGAVVPFWLADLASLTFWMNILMAHAGWFNYVLCVLWSLCVEEVFYLGFPVLCRVLRRDIFILAACLVFIVMGPVWRALHQDDENVYLFAYLACFDGIAFGCGAALLRPRLELPARIARMLHAISIGLVCFVYVGRSIADWNILGVTLVAAGTATMILTHVPSQKKAMVFISVFCGYVARAGRLSLELYLFHLIVLGGLLSLWPPDAASSETKMILLPVYLVISGLLAALIAHFYSNPLNRMIRRA